MERRGTDRRNTQKKALKEAAPMHKEQVEITEKNSVARPAIDDDIIYLEHLLSLTILSSYMLNLDSPIPKTSSV